MDGGENHQQTGDSRERGDQIPAQRARHYHEDQLYYYFFFFRKITIIFLSYKNYSNFIIFVILKVKFKQIEIFLGF